MGVCEILYNSIGEGIKKSTCFAVYRSMVSFRKIRLIRIKTFCYLTNLSEKKNDKILCVNDQCVDRVFETTCFSVTVSTNHLEISLTNEKRRR